MTHAEHWSAVLGDRESSLATLLPRTIERGALVAEATVHLDDERGSNSRRETGFALKYPATPLRYLALCATDSTGPVIERELVTAYPFCAEGLEAELEVDEVVRVPDDPMEGGLQVAAPWGGLDVVHRSAVLPEPRTVHGRSRATLLARRHGTHDRRSLPGSADHGRAAARAGRVRTRAWGLLASNRR